MLMPAEMSFVQILVSKMDLASVAVRLSRRKALHIAEIRDLGAPFKLRPIINDNNRLALLAVLERRLNAILQEFGEFDPIPQDTGHHYTYTSTSSSFDPARVAGEADKFLGEIEPAVRAVTDRMRRLVEEKERKELMRQEMLHIQSLDVNLGVLKDLRFISVAMGRIPRENLARLEESLREMPNIVVSCPYARDEVFIIAVTLKELWPKLQAALKGAYFSPIELGVDAAGTPEEILRGLENDISAIESDMEGERKRLMALALRWRKPLLEYLHRVKFNRSILEFYTHFKGTEGTALLTGFIPTGEVESVRREIEMVTGGRLVFESEPVPPDGTREPEVRVPTLLRHARFLMPFEALTTTYGYPRYGELDPTVILAVTYVFMFGFMFGDLGQGIIIAAIGAFLLKSPPARLRSLSGAAGFLMACGASASIFGLLYGSVFGREGLMPALWERPIENITSFLVVGIFYGIIQNILGLGINLVNSFRAREPKEAVFGEFGVVSSAFYLTMLGVVYALLSSHALRIAQIGIGVSLVLLAVLILREPLGRYIFGGAADPERENAEAQGDSGIFGSLLGAFDIFLRHITNSISFVRLPAFAIAHGALGIAIYTIARAAAGAPGGPILSAVVIILGNIGVIALEGMIVGIQCLRLEFYEFFSKFLHGDGVPYKPWCLDLDMENGLENRRGVESA